jgi:tRNA (cytidine32/uridine32-2'-O)-methyltransferase
MLEILEQLRIVLVGTTHPGNIGSTARAMKTMGIHQLVLIDPRTFPSAEATALAAGADDVLLQAKVGSTLAASLADCVWVVGTSARRRDHSAPLLTPEGAAGQLLQYALEGPVALVFGRESSGLTNEELDRCNAWVQIPTDARFRSLNLAAAVQVMTYLCRRAAEALSEDAPPVGAAFDPDPPATQREMDDLLAHYARVLVQIQFLDPARPRHLLRRLQHLYARAGLRASEVRILRGILTHTEQAQAGAVSRHER